MAVLIKTFNFARASGSSTAHATVLYDADLGILDFGPEETALTYLEMSLQMLTALPETAISSTHRVEKNCSGNISDAVIDVYSARLTGTDTIKTSVTCQCSNQSLLIPS